MLTLKRFSFSALLQFDCISLAKVNIATFQLISLTTIKMSSSTLFPVIEGVDIEENSSFFQTIYTQARK